MKAWVVVVAAALMVGFFIVEMEGNHQSEAIEDSNMLEPPFESLPTVAPSQTLTRGGRPHYRAILLVLSSNQNSLQVFQRSVYRAYMEREPTIKALFVYACDSGMMPHCVDPEHDLYYSEVRESPLIGVRKVVRAFRTIEASYSYDYIVRTNIGTFWILPNLVKELNSGIPSTRFYSGSGPLPPDAESKEKFFVSAVGCIISRDLIQSLLENADLIDYTTYEDRALGKYFHYVMGVPLNVTNRIHFIIHLAKLDIHALQQEVHAAIAQEKTHFRVKANTNRLLVDPWVHRTLLRYFYNATPSTDKYQLCARAPAEPDVCKGFRPVM